MTQQKDTAASSADGTIDAGLTTNSKQPYVAPSLELLDIEATRNGPGVAPDSGGIDFS